MLRKFTPIVALLLLLGSAQTLQAQVTVPYTVADGETIDAARINANFAVFADALNRTGGTMTGTLTSQQITPSANNTYDLGVTGTRFRDLWLSRNATIAGVLSTATPTANGIGGSTGNSVGLYITTTATAFGALGEGVRITGGTLTAAANNDILTWLNVGETGVAAKGAFTGLTFNVAQVKGSNSTASGGGTIDNASTLYIADAPTIGTANYALRVGSGNISLGNGTVSSAGRYQSATLQPGFYAYNSVTDANQVTGTTVEFDTEIYDNSTSFDTGTDTFTAPIAGQYLFCAAVRTENATAGANVTHNLVTSNRTYNLFFEGGTDGADSGSSCVVADMDATDTAHIAVSVSVNNIDHVGGTNVTYFSGRLLP